MKNYIMTTSYTNKIYKRLKIDFKRSKIRLNIKSSLAEYNK